GAIMRLIPAEEVVARIQAENPWWQSPHEVAKPFSTWRPRAYLDLFLKLLNEKSVQRAIVLLGPRRVGKTVLIAHAIQQLLKSGVEPRAICYLAVDHPIYTGLGLEELISSALKASALEPRPDTLYFFFDEIQYLREWEQHLKSVVDAHPTYRVIASGSAAAALRLKSLESGAGRFTDFLLPPLTFYEYLDLLELHDLMQVDETSGKTLYNARDLSKLNEEFIKYLNIGGYPEALFSPAIQADPARFIKADIVDKVLLRDLPSLYGIQDIQELNYLFTTLAFNTAGEVSLEELSKGSGVAKNTLRRYIEYLEAAFLIKVVHRIDQNSRRFQRATSFKVYLTNPSIRAALFTPAKADDDVMGHLAETGVFSQWFHQSMNLHYARWRDGEVDIVALNEKQKPLWAVEVKWSDRFYDRREELAPLVHFCRTNSLSKALITTKTKKGECEIQGIQLRFQPASEYAFVLGRNIIRGKIALQQVFQGNRKASA
ncbi:MAG TPA: ATP-binding protein, partial [Candidatus Polarisedimenticolia bacterium]|nr:ATP-binding protein [Candidatus Polarisedimenticolia bacterium]